MGVALLLGVALGLAVAVAGIILALTGGGLPVGLLLILAGALVVFEARRGDGPRKQLERAIPIALPQAFLWRVLGRIPTPVGRLTDERKLSLALRRRKGRTRGAPRRQAPEPPRT